MEERFWGDWRGFNRDDATGSRGKTTKKKIFKTTGIIPSDGLVYNLSQEEGHKE
jgi:hypothetical protein